MLFLNISVYQENDHIKLKFHATLKNEEKSRLVPDLPSEHFNEKYRTLSIQSIMETRFAYPDSTVLTTALNRVVEKQASNEVISVYELPTDPQVALDFLAACYNHVLSKGFDQVRVNQVEIINKNKEKMVNPAKELAKQIFKINASTKYTETFNVLQKISQWKKEQHETSFEECLEIKKRFAILLDINLDKKFLRDDNVDVTKKHQYLQKILRKMLSETHQKAFDHLLASMDRENKIEIFARFMFDNEKASWDDPEWKFIRDSQFYLRKDGKIGIKVKENAAYDEFYALGKPYHQDMQKRLEAVTESNESCIDLQSDFHDEIIFTPETSKKLIQQEMHINKTFITNLMNESKNQSRLFSSSSPTITEAGLAIIKNILNYADYDIEQSHLYDTEIKSQQEPMQRSSLHM